ncbi:MAG: hypothetical protein ABJA90_05955 [Ginsengibacter sp.]
MKHYVLRTIILLVLSLSFFDLAFSQNSIQDSVQQSLQLQNAINLYHQSLIPETGLYNGSEYAYKAYYPYAINEGDPFFISREFYSGSVFYNGLLYQNIPLLYDIIKGELLTKDLSQINIIRLNEEKVRWFTIYNQTFYRLVKDSIAKNTVSTDFYDGLYIGNTSLYKHVSKIFKENSSSAQGINRYVVEKDEFFIKKGNEYFRINNRKSLLNVLSDRKKDIGQFMSKSKLKLKKNKEDAFIKVVTYYDGLTGSTIQANK